MLINRYTPYQFKTNQIAKNRVVVPPMASRTADEKGFVTERTLEHYQRLCKSSAGLVFVEYSFIHPSGRGEINHLGVDDDSKIPGMTEIASVIHDSGALAGLQIVHVGGRTTSRLTGLPLMTPSAVPVPVVNGEPELPTASMTEPEIQLWIDWFLEAAHRAASAKFDFVELHAAHGYGLNQWLSPLTNHRQDSYGGGIEGRSLLPRTIAYEIKRAYPQLLLSVRLPGQDYLEGGLTITEMIWVVSQFEKIGTDLIDVSSGIGGWRAPAGSSGQGYLVSDAHQIKVTTSLPVMGVGGIQTGEFVDEILMTSKIDFAAVGRAILQDPENWGKRNLSVDGQKS